MTADLIRRLEEATEGSRELDSLIYVATFAGADRRARAVVGGGVIVYGPGFEADSVGVPRVTTSLDAALSLAERVLPAATANGRPGRLTRLSQRFNGTWEAASYRVADGLTHEAVAATPALALCIAILKATPTPDAGPQAEEGDHHVEA